MAALYLLRNGLCSTKASQIGFRELATCCQLYKQESASHLVIPKEPLAVVASKIQVLDEETKKELSPCPLEYKADIPKAKMTAAELAKMPLHYMSLGKARLTSLVMFSSAAGYMMGAAPVDPKVLGLCVLGTGLTSASSHAFNQIMEVPFDAQMGRTRNRLLVRNIISPNHAAIFGAITGAAGLSVLYAGVNPLTCSLGALTWLLYVGAYTPMKRTTIYNTWVGSVVGGLPTLMGYTGCMNTVDLAGLLLLGVTYAWQFPHFNSLSWYLRHDYGKAGYKMMSVCNKDLCRSTTLRYSLGMFAICTAFPVAGLTHWGFALTSLPVNGLLLFLSYKFYKKPENGIARQLFRYSLIYLPLIFLLMLVQKEKQTVVIEDALMETDKRTSDS